MNAYLVDSNVLLDVIGADTSFGEASRACLEACAAKGVLVINPVIYAEVGAFIDSIEELDALLPKGLFRRDALPWDVSYLAGQALRRYQKNGGKRDRVLADFMIGAHAAVAGMTVLSRDKGYARYFQLEVINPTGQGHRLVD